jgi:hypothetical protein
MEALSALFPERPEPRSEYWNAVGDLSEVKGVFRIYPVVSAQDFVNEFIGLTATVER